MKLPKLNSNGPTLVTKNSRNAHRVNKATVTAIVPRRRFEKTATFQQPRPFPLPVSKIDV